MARLEVVKVEQCQRCLYSTVKARPVVDAAELSLKKKNYWSNMNNQRAFFDRIAVKLQIKELDDWYKVIFPLTGLIQHELFIDHLIR